VRIAGPWRAVRGGIVLLAAGCDRTIDVAFGLPDTGGRSVIVAIEREDDPAIQVFARNLPLMRSIELEADGATVFTAFAYPSALDDLRVPEGEIEGEIDGAPIPVATSTIQVARVSAEGDLDPWQPGSPSDRILAFRFTPIGRPDPCPETRLVRVDLPVFPEERPIVLAAFDENTALIGTDVDGRVFLATRDGARLEPTLSALDEQNLFPTTGAWRSPEGRIFFAGPGGHLAEVTRDGDRFIPAILSSSTSTMSARIKDIAGNITESGIDIVGVDSDGRGLWWNSARGSWIVTPRGGEWEGTEQIDAVWPDEAFFTHGDGGVTRMVLERGPAPRIVRTFEPLVDAEIGRPGSIIAHPTLGLLTAVLTDAFGAIFQRAPPVWRAIHGRVGLGGVTQIRDAGEGRILWTSPNGFIGFITPEKVCGQISIVQEPIVLVETVLERRTAIMVDSGGTDDPSYVYFVEW
jgi:hypothetical protein